MVAGVWVEGIYLATQVQKDKPNKKLAEHIGEQKNMLAELLIILNNYKKEKYIADLITELYTIKAKFDPITISIIKGEPEQVVENGMLTIKQNERSVVNITDEQLKDIINTSEQVRNKLVKIQ
jgi:DNA-binding TFAR19-related protein (PDSD5 family)